LLHHVPNQAFGHAVTPALSGSANTAQQLSHFVQRPRPMCLRSL
jgi:hypothetical protein